MTQYTPPVILEGPFRPDEARAGWLLLLVLLGAALLTGLLDDDDDACSPGPRRTVDVSRGGW